MRRANGTTETAEVLTLLRQVEEAVLPGSAVSGRPSQGSRPPASLGALSLLASIGARSSSAAAPTATPSGPR